MPVRLNAKGPGGVRPGPPVRPRGRRAGLRRVNVSGLQGPSEGRRVLETAVRPMPSPRPTRRALSSARPENRSRFGRPTRFLASLTQHGTFLPKG